MCSVFVVFGAQVQIDSCEIEITIAATIFSGFDASFADMHMVKMHGCSMVGCKISKSEAKDKIMIGIKGLLWSLEC